MSNERQAAGNSKMMLELKRIEWRQMMLKEHYEELCELAKNVKYKEKLLYDPTKYNKPV